MDMWPVIILQTNEFNSSDEEKQEDPIPPPKA